MTRSVYLQFELSVNYPKNFVSVQLYEYIHYNNEKWPRTKLIMERNVKIEGLFSPIRELSLRLDKAQRSMTLTYKRNKGRYQMIESFARMSKFPRIMCEDSRTNQMINGLKK